VIAPDQVERLTEPFRRLSRRTAGYGLGLSIVDSVVKAHGGRLTVTAPPSGGLEVRVELPAAPAPRPARGRVVTGRR
jgi:signal transduction histidine kinase